MKHIESSLGKLKLDSCVTVASGTFGLEYFKLRDSEGKPLLPQESLGAYVSKTITYEPKAGNPSPRLYETECGLLNSIGLQNPGLKGFLHTDLPVLKETLRIPLIVSFSGSSIAEFCEMITAMEPYDEIAGFEVNVSCPNVEKEGIAFGADPEVIHTLVSRLAALTDKELIVKLSPNVTDIAQMALAAQEAGASSLALINTLWGMAIDWKTGKPMLSRKVGGYSGRGVKPVALALVYKAAQAVDIPILAMGGIHTWQDALEFIYAGASAVAVGTANFNDPGAPAKIAKGLHEHCRTNNIHIRDLIAKVR